MMISMFLHEKLLFNFHEKLHFLENAGKMFSHLNRLLSINEMQILKLISPPEMENNDDQNTFHAHECSNSQRELLLAASAGA